MPNLSFSFLSLFQSLGNQKSSFSTRDLLITYFMFSKAWLTKDVRVPRRASYVSALHVLKVKQWSKAMDFLQNLLQHEYFISPILKKHRIRLECSRLDLPSSIK